MRFELLDNVSHPSFLHRDCDLPTRGHPHSSPSHITPHPKSRWCDAVSVPCVPDTPQINQMSDLRSSQQVREPYIDPFPLRHDHTILSVHGCHRLPPRAPVGRLTLQRFLIQTRLSLLTAHLPIDDPLGRSPITSGQTYHGGNPVALSRERKPLVPPIESW